MNPEEMDEQFWLETGDKSLDHAVEWRKRWQLSLGLGNGAALLSTVNALQNAKTVINQESLVASAWLFLFGIVCSALIALTRYKSLSSHAFWRSLLAANPSQFGDDFKDILVMRKMKPFKKFCHICLPRRAGSNTSIAHYYVGKRWATLTTICTAFAASCFVVGVSWSLLAAA